MFRHIDHTHHLPDFVVEMGKPDQGIEHHVVDRSNQDPVSILKLYTISTDAWDATHPSHRGCFIGYPCCVTGDKSCARISHLSKFHHTYGTCYKWSPDHIYCSVLTSQSEKRMFPDCAECGVLIEIWDLILINRRLLHDNKQITTVEDCRLVQNSLNGYVKAYKIRRAAHVADLRNRADDLFEAQVKFAKAGLEAPAAKTTSWWLVVVDKFANFWRCH